MKTFKIKYDDFYKAKLPVYECPLEYYEEPIKQIINRYNISNKTLLSVGCGAGREEYWFYKHGKNQLTMVDIDESKLIEPILSKIQHPDGELAYIIGDALNINFKDRKFDVLYFSGFTPDEVHRGRVRANSLSKGVIKRTWDNTSNPFADLVMDITDHCLESNGTLIIQSYSGGPNILRHKRYIELCAEQFSRHGLTLLDVFCWEKIPHVALYVGVKTVEKDKIKISNQQSAISNQQSAISNQQSAISNHFISWQR